MKFRRGGEYHGTNPDVVRALHRTVDPGLARLRSTAAGVDATDQHEDGMRGPHLLRRATAGPDPEAFARFAELVERRPPTSPRDLLGVAAPGDPVSLAAVEPAAAIVARFSTAAISLGAISPEATRRSRPAPTAWARARTPARAARIRRASAPSGARGSSRSPPRASASRPPTWCRPTNSRSRSRRGPSPERAGSSPPVKVTEGIAALRHAQPGIDLISPAPHHDIYSIEDLAQLVFDLRQVNPTADVSVKLVAEAGVGTVAAGVTKALADVVHVAGADGGTGASPLASIRHAGLPWELGLAETRRRLVEDGLRDRVRLRVDGGFRIGRDVVVAAMLGADEFSFGTAVLVAQGCLMVRTCHLDTCPVGIATQRPELRARFAGTPEMVSAYLTLVAEDARRILASLGLRSIGEAVGRTDLLSADRDRIGSSGLEVSGLLEGTGGGFVRVPFERPRAALGDRLAEEALPALLGPGGSRLSYPVTNRDRAVGARLAGAAARELGEEAPPGHVRVSLRGDAGQSLGAFLAGGIELHLTGTANDGVGKGMAGGLIAIAAPGGTEGHPELIGNTALYGATGGELFVAGAAGERFAVRNSGATSVVEGVGANGCEYMTGGLVVVLGPVGPNFAAGMTGGLAYVLDPEALEGRINPDLVRIVDLSVEGRHELADLLRRHLRHTASERASGILASWPASSSAFRCVVPKRPATEVPLAESEPAEASSAGRR